MGGERSQLAPAPHGTPAAFGITRHDGSQAARAGRPRDARGPLCVPIRSCCPPPQALLGPGSLLPRSARVQIHPKFTHKNEQRQSQLAGLQPQRAPVWGPVSPRDSVSHAVSPRDSGTAQHPTAPTRHPARTTTSYPNQHALPITALTATAITAPAAFRLRDLRAEAITARTSLPRSRSP